jgi:hypothetical protein
MMKKVFVIGTIIAMLALTLLNTDPVFAQDSEDPSVPPWEPGRGGRGRWGGNMMTPPMGNSGGLIDGLLGTLIHENLAVALGLTPEQLSALQENDASFIAFALEKGYEYAEVQDLMATAREEAVTEALTEGLITQEQADWIRSRFEVMQTRVSMYGDQQCYSGDFTPQEDTPFEFGSGGHGYRGKR